ncbi:uncharacterized protein LOC123537050 isoform X2 [Mercenaria mercenaria]|uniref:uncharacterized protein LOC123537050 isoform X2 n=1 Tax=Mercenaria mercenaria TaxID=6596 RepID=UPI00234F240D|nr:uncharacterized protein LOC123537050 isoform X2 [Mercenaria mercenaria]
MIKEFPVTENVDTLLISIRKLFHYSPRNYAIFQAIQESYGLKKLKFIRAATTRWLSHGKSCVRLIDRYEQVLDAIDASLDDKYVPEVYGLRHQLLDKPTVAMVLVLCDILRLVINFSDYLQGENVFSDMHIRCGELIDQLHHLVVRFDVSVERPDQDLYLSRMETLFQVIDDRTALARRLRGPAMMTPRQVVEEIAKPVTYALINEISDAFQCSPVLAAFSVFNLQKVPENVAEISLYGEAKRWCRCYCSIQRG